MPASYEFTEPVPLSGFKDLPPNYMMDSMREHQDFQSKALAGAGNAQRMNELEMKLDAIGQLLYQNRHLFEGVIPDLAAPTGPRMPQKPPRSESDIRMEMQEHQDKAKADGMFERKDE